MWDIFEGCDPRDDDTWSIGALLCYFFFAGIAVLAVLTIFF